MIGVLLGELDDLARPLLLLHLLVAEQVGLLACGSLGRSVVHLFMAHQAIRRDRDPAARAHVSDTVKYGRGRPSGRWDATKQPVGTNLPLAAFRAPLAFTRFQPMKSHLASERRVVSMSVSAADPVLARFVPEEGPLALPAALFTTPNPIDLLFIDHSN